MKKAILASHFRHLKSYFQHFEHYPKLYFSDNYETQFLRYKTSPFLGILVPFWPFYPLFSHFSLSIRLGLFGNYPKLEPYDNFEGFQAFVRLLVAEISNFLFFVDVSIAHKKNCPTLVTSQYSCCCSTRPIGSLLAKISSITFFCSLGMKFSFWLLYYSHQLVQLIACLLEF